MKKNETKQSNKIYTNLFSPMCIILLPVFVYSWNLPKNSRKTEKLTKPNSNWH